MLFRRARDQVSSAHDLVAKGRCGIRQALPLMRLMRPRDTRFNVDEIQFDQLVKLRLGQIITAP
ncbi:hypothetical protein D3C87_1590510 [compost metagenome]